MKVQLVTFAILGLSVVSFGKAPDLSILQGNWTVKSAVLAGKAFTPAMTGMWELTVSGNKFKFFDGSATEIGTLEVNPAKNPKQMVIHSLKGPNAGKPILCIYKASPGHVTICYGLAGKRPTEFKSAKGTQNFLVEYVPERPSLRPRPSSPE